MHHLTRLGIEAYKGGSRSQAQRYFRQALIEDPQDIITWLWLVEVSDSDLEKQRCLERILKIDPQHIPARQALIEIQSRLHASQLPHVNPFFQDDDPANLPVSSTNPFQGPFSVPLNEAGTPVARPRRVTAAAPKREDPSEKRKSFPVIWIWGGLVGLAGLAGLIYWLVR